MPGDQHAVAGLRRAVGRPERAEVGLGHDLVVDDLLGDEVVGDDHVDDGLTRGVFADRAADRVSLRLQVADDGDIALLGGHTQIVVDPFHVGVQRRRVELRHGAQERC